MARKNGNQQIIARVPARTTRRRRRRVANVSRMLNRQMSPSECVAYSIQNPFDYSCCLPDGSKGTGCFSIRQIGTIAPAALGTVMALAICPQSPKGIGFLDSGNAASTYTISGNYFDASQIASMVSLYKAVRCVSAGIRLTYVGNTINDQGVLTAAQLPRSTVLSTALNGGTLATVNANCMWLYQRPARNGIEIVWRPEDEMDYAQFVDLDTGTIAVGTERTKPIIWVSADSLNGVASTFSFEWVANFEGQFLNQTFMPGGLNTDGGNARVEPGWYPKVLGMLESVAPYAQSVGNAVYNAAAQAAPYVGQAMANGAQQYLLPGRDRGNGFFRPPRLRLEL